MRIRHIEIDLKSTFKELLEMAWKNLIPLDKIWMVEPNAWLKNEKTHWSDVYYIRYKFNTGRIVSALGASTILTKH